MAKKTAKKERQQKFNLLEITGFKHPGTYPKQPGGFFGYTHLKNPHFYFNLILVYTLYATNNAIFYYF